MKYIELSKEMQATVDDDMYDFLNQWSWYVSSNGYAVRNEYHPKHMTLRMHVLINNTPEGFFTDHINGNKLDNRRSNLRTCTKNENGFNRDKPSNNTSGYKGIYWHKRDNKWRVQLRVDGKKKYIGNYSDLQDAIMARNKAALTYHGGFAKLD